MPETTQQRRRIDQELVARKLVASRARARDLIKRGTVRVNGEVASKPGMLVDNTATIEVNDRVNRFVARSGEKLLAALDYFNLDPSGRTVLDIGASTGGFTQVLLERGAAHVYALDVGKDQLHDTLRNDNHVSDLSQTDVRFVTAQAFDRPVTAVTADVSFISLTKALPPVLDIPQPGAWLAALVKPQFELEKANIGKDGVVKDEALRTMAVDRVRKMLGLHGWQPLGDMASPLPGKRGNIEYIIAARRSLETISTPDRIL